MQYSTVQYTAGMASDMEYKDVFYANVARPNSTLCIVDPIYTVDCRLYVCMYSDSSIDLSFSLVVVERGHFSRTSQLFREKYIYSQAKNIYIVGP